jgi:hypothetical protein
MDQQSSSTQINEPTDDHLKKLLDQDHLTEVRKAAEKKYEQLTTDEYHNLRHKFKTDLLFLATALGYRKLSPNLHGHFCRWLQATRNEQFREELLPRGHYKSTICTICDSVQLVLPDELGGVPYPYNLGTNARVMIGHETHDGGSTRFLFSISAHFLGNPTLVGLFPELVPDPRKHRINKHELELPRTEVWSEPTFDTMGVGSRSQGRHFNKLKLDDLFGDKARDSATERETTYDWFDNIQSFFVSLAVDQFDLTGTRWGFDDIYAHAEEMYGDRLKRYSRPVEEFNPITKKKEPIFPEEFPSSSLEILRKKPKIWFSQYMNDPREGQAEFDPSWRKYFYWLGDSKIGFFEGEGRTTTQIWDLDRVILVDPAMSGLSGIVVTGSDWKNRIFSLEAKKLALKPPEFVELIFKLVSRWQPRIVAIEEVLFSGLFKHWLEREMLIRGIRFNIVPVKTRQKEKNARIAGLANYFSSGQFFFHEGQKDLLDEYDSFGASLDIHLLDALAYGPELWRPAVRREDLERRQNLESQLLSGRDVLTGYSEI